MAYPITALSPDHEQEAQTFLREAKAAIAHHGSFGLTFSEWPYVAAGVWDRLEELATLSGWSTVLDAERIEMRRPSRASATCRIGRESHAVPGRACRLEGGEYLPADGLPGQDPDRHYAV
jgi:hypothetical protein